MKVLLNPSTENQPDSHSNLGTLDVFFGAHAINMIIHVRYLNPCVSPTRECSSKTSEALVMGN